MDIKKLLQDTKMSMSKPHDMTPLEGTQQVAYEYTLKNQQPIPIDFYMDESDFVEIKEEYLGDSDLWLDNFSDEIKLQAQQALNTTDLTKTDPNFMGFTVAQVKLDGDDLKKGSLTIEVQAFYEIPFNKISESVAQGLSLLGK